MKYVSASEFKAHCLRLMAEVQAGGEAITVTKRGKPLAVVGPAELQPAKKPLKSAYGLLRNDEYRFDDPFTPVSDMEAWEENNPAGLYRRP